MKVQNGAAGSTSVVGIGGEESRGLGTHELTGFEVISEATDQCPDGSVCDSISGTAITCVFSCKAAEDCRSDLDCNGVSGTNIIKACKPKT